MINKSVIQWIKTHQYLILILAIIFFGSFLRIYNLDRNEIWGDEAEFIILAKNIRSFGFPIARIDYRYLVDAGVKPGYGINSDDIWVYHSWGSPYLLAFSSMFFGWSEFSMRLPFVLFGILSLIFIYLLAKKLYDKEVGLYSLFLGSFSIFLINYTRQVRYYSLEIFGLVTSFYFFIKATEENKFKDWILSSLCFIFLFHANYAFALPALSIILLYYIYLNRKNMYKILNKNFFTWLLIAFLLTVPWFLYAQPWKLASSIGVGSTISKNSLFYTVATLFKEIPLPLFILGIPMLINKFEKNFFLSLWLLLYLLFPIVLDYVAPRGLLLFYIASIIFLSLIIKRIREVILLRLGNISNYLVVILLILITFTSVFNLQFYKISEKENITKIWSINKTPPLLEFNFPVNYGNYKYIQVTYEPFRCELCMYILSLREDFYGPARATAEFLKGNAERNDVIISNAGTTPLLIYTNLKVYPLRYYSQSYFDNLTKGNNIWFIYRQYWGISEEYSELVKYWTTQCKEYTLNAPDLIWNNNPDFPIYGIPEDLEPLRVYYCKKK